MWLGTVLKFFDALGIADGVVRTAMSRLAADGWLERSRVGRNSFYRLAAKGHETFRQATEHIYNPRPPRWDGYFDFVISNGGDRDVVRAAMSEAGFGGLAGDMWIAPAGRALPSGASGGFRLRLSGDNDTNRALAARVWPVDEMKTAYERFLAAFTPLRDALNATAALDECDAMVARVLLVHEYRRIVLRDPMLPVDILPEQWPGTAARTLCADIYEQVVPASERWLDANAVGEDGAPLPAPVGIQQRFSRV